MLKEDVMMLLYNYCSWKDCPSIKKLFKDYPTQIDLTDDDGMLFRMAVAYKSTELLTTLLDFYKATKLQGNPQSLEYKLAYTQLRHMLDDAAEAHDVVPAIQVIIEPYLTKEEESEDDQDLDGFDAINLDFHNTLHHSYSEPDLIQHQQVSSKLLLHSSSESLLSTLDSSGSDVHDTSNLGQESGLLTDF